MFGLGLPEIGILAVIGVLLFGPSKFPQLGKGLGEAISGFKQVLKGTEPNTAVIEKVEKNKI